jgi:alkanesulfonate monooxygenase SsuD/methylene tetrahydromethanopterin reductase-like flavin-dependent oxidoreductase (luciferase family)
MFPPTRAIQELPAAARLLERLGFDELWIAEDCFAHGGVAAAASALACTERLSVGIGLLPASVRNVAMIAMELGSLALLHPGRVQAAFGHGVEAWMRQIGARPPNRVTALREVVSATRSLLRGETVTVTGSHITLDRVALDRPPEPAPLVLIGTTGTQGIAAAREVADGLLLPEGSGPAAVRWATALLDGAGSATVYAWTRVDDDRARALDRVRPVVRAWRDGGLYPRLVASSGLAATGEIDDRQIEELAVAGSPRDCAAAVSHLRAAGAASLVFAPVGDDRPQLERIAADVLPLLEPRVTARAS